jgi:hypothetical protein
MAHPHFAGIVVKRGCVFAQWPPEFNLPRRLEGLDLDKLWIYESSLSFA